MNLLKSLLLVSLAGAVSAEEPKVLDHDALNSEARIRRAVEEKFPGLNFGFYHFTGVWIIGALEDFDRERVLLLLPGEGIGESKFSRNGKALDLPLGPAVSLKVAGALHTADGVVNEPDRAYDSRIGYWVELRATDRFQAEIDLTSPEKGRFTATYDPDHRWQTSCTFEVADQDRRKPADAYEISRGSLLQEVRDVLGTKDESLVRLESRTDIVVNTWSPKAGSEIDPLVLTVTDKMLLGTDDGKKEQTPQELKWALRQYRSAAKTTGVVARVKMHVAEDADDRVFRAALNALADEDFRVVFLAREKED